MLKIETVIKVHMYCIPKFPDQNVQIDSHTKVTKNIHKIAETCAWYAKVKGYSEGLV
jgi:hypothetical protein